MSSKMLALPIATSRLNLDAVTVDDAEFFLELLNERSYIDNIRDKGVRNLKQAASYIENIVRRSYVNHGFGMYAVKLKASGEALGICGLVKRDGLEQVDVGFAFLPRYWRKGYAYEATQAVMQFAFRGLKYEKLAAIVTPRNEPSLRLLEKLGFTIQKLIQLSGDSERLQLLTIDCQTFNNGKT